MYVKRVVSHNASSALKMYGLEAYSELPMSWVIGHNLVFADGYQRVSLSPV